MSSCEPVGASRAGRLLAVDPPKMPAVRVHTERQPRRSPGVRIPPAPVVVLTTTLTLVRLHVSCPAVRTPDLSNPRPIYSRGERVVRRRLRQQCRSAEALPVGEVVVDTTCPLRRRRADVAPPNAPKQQPKTSGPTRATAGWDADLPVRKGPLRSANQMSNERATPQLAEIAPAIAPFLIGGANFESTVK